MKKYYTDEINAQVVLAVLKAHGIRKVVASPGATNVTLVGSMQHDPYFEMYSAVDERSAAYMACGLAAESGEPVVITCTGATASRNYLPGLTEAYYRKLPVLAITSTQPVARVGHLVAQVIDRSAKPNDTVRISVNLPVVKDDEDLWECECKVNQAVNELTRHGGGPAHINLPTRYSKNFDVKELPQYRVIRRVERGQPFPAIPSGRIAVFVGSHKKWSKDESLALERFCASNNAVVVCDHSSGYRGEFRLLHALAAGQVMAEQGALMADLLIHIGEVSGDYYGPRIGGKDVWRISKDGEIRDPFRKLSYIFEMGEDEFFRHYTADREPRHNEYFEQCSKRLDTLREMIPELPFSNIWLASKLAHRIPDNSVVHFGILNSLRSWNFYELPETVTSASNVGGFGIDGGMSTLLGASLADANRLYFGVIGDLAFFYDLNALGNRHVGGNLRILLVNNGKGTEFKQYGHHAAHFEDEADAFIAAAGHFGNQSRSLVKQYVQNLGLEYISASDPGEFNQVYLQFLNPQIGEKSLVFEVFTDSQMESHALQLVLNVEETVKGKAKQYAKEMLGEGGIRMLRKIIK